MKADRYAAAGDKAKSRIYASFADGWLLAAFDLA